MESMHKRLKRFLLDILVREKETQAETWQHLKMLDPDCDDLDIVITGTPFADEAWELYKTKNPGKEDLLYLMKWSPKKEEAEAFLTERFELDNEDLKSLIETTRNDRFARLLLGRNPDKEQLISIMEHTRLKDEAAAELLKQTPDNEELYEIIVHSGLKQAAWEKLKTQNPEKKELSQIIRYADPGGLEDEIWEHFLQQNPDNEELLDFVKDYSETGRKKQEAAALLIERNPGTNELIHLISQNLYTGLALEKLKKKEPDCEELELIFRIGKSGTDELADLSLSLHPDKNQLWKIFEHSNRKDEAALQLIQLPLECNELANLIVGTAIEPVQELVSKRVQFDRSQVNEAELMREIAQKLIQNPELLNVNHWHQGETHCIGGWAITLNEAAQKVEKQFSSEIAACLLLPSYRHLFFADKETVLNALKNI